MHTTEIIAAGQQFECLRDEWTELLNHSSSNSIFLTWEWLHTWWRHIARRRRLFLITVRERHQLIAVAPFVQRPPNLARLLPSRSLEFLGTGLIGSDYLDIIVREGKEEAAGDQLADWLSKNRIVLSLTHVQPSSMALRLADRLARRNWRTVSEKFNVCPYIDLRTHSWDSYLQTLSSSHRYNFRRQLRQLQSRYEVKFGRVLSEDRREQALAELWDLHNRRWENRGGSDGLTGHDMLAFHRDFTRLALQRGWLRLFVVSIDGKPAAALYGFMYDGVFSYYQAGLDPAYGRFSLGVLTLGMVIRNAMEEGAAEFDMLHGDESYKFRWTKNTRDLATVEMYPPDALGLLCQSGVNLSRASRRMARTLLPSGMRIRIAAAIHADSWKGMAGARTH